MLHPVWTASEKNFEGDIKLTLPELPGTKTGWKSIVRGKRGITDASYAQKDYPPNYKRLIRSQKTTNASSLQLDLVPKSRSCINLDPKFNRKWGFFNQERFFSVGERDGGGVPISGKVGRTSCKVWTSISREDPFCISGHIVGSPLHRRRKKLVGCFRRRRRRR